MKKINTTNEESSIKLIKFTREAKIRSPLTNFEEVTQEIEYRRDPLLNHWSRINALRAERVKQAKTPGESFEENLRKLIETSQAKCFFCEENITKSTPQFPSHLSIGERLVEGNFTLFPNLFVFSEYHAVGTLGSSHFTQLDKIGSETWKNALVGTNRFFKAVYSYDSEIRYPSINFNFLPPSASSIVHPHIQVIQDIQPTKLTELIIAQSKSFYQQSNNKNYWLELIDIERELKQRFISETEEMVWIATFSPMGKNELTGICKIPKTDLTQFNEQELESFAREIQKAITALYNGRGARSINLAMFLGPLGEDLSDYFRINIKIVTRPTLEANYTADVGFMEMLHQETIGEATPEMIAETVKPFFNKT